VDAARSYYITVFKVMLMQKERTPVPMDDIFDE